MTSRSAHLDSSATGAFRRDVKVIGLIGSAHCLSHFFQLVFSMGLGSGVFPPADFAVLNANVAPRRLGHAYSAHGIGGSLGYALAPVVSYGLGSMIGWRQALMMLGAVGLVALAALATQ